MPDTEQNAARRTVWMSDELWRKVSQASNLLSLETGDDISKGEIVRRGIRREVAEVMSDGEYEAP